MNNVNFKHVIIMYSNFGSYLNKGVYMYNMCVFIKTYVYTVTFNPMKKI
jgi:hypothetical protein